MKVDEILCFILNHKLDPQSKELDTYGSCIRCGDWFGNNEHNWTLPGLYHTIKHETIDKRISALNIAVGRLRVQSIGYQVYADILVEMMTELQQEKASKEIKLRHHRAKNERGVNY